ncbi:MAG: GtrA family protein [Sphingomonas bacterium]
MKRRLNLARLVELSRFYQAAAINALFGFGMYAILIWLGLNLYVAQIVAHCLGVAFNYLTYSRHVFRDSEPAKTRFVLAYALNYLVSLASLALVSQFLKSPYVAGLVALGLASGINYFALKYAVFEKRRA